MEYGEKPVLRCCGGTMADKHCLIPEETGSISSPASTADTTSTPYGSAQATLQRPRDGIAR